MEDKTEIRILEKDNNRRGDLFGRLMADLFVALGYEQPRLNIHKSGREIDLSADHRLEPRRAIGECKATSEPIGGADLNKFVGVLDAEQEDKRPITGYFISLDGFTEPAVEQEKQRRTKIVTLTGSQVVSELVKGRILVTKDRATELAGRCCASLQDLILDPEAELLAHERGWIWAIYYTQGKARTHFVLIHSDGTPLARALAEEVIAADLECKGELEKLTCLNPEPPTGSDIGTHIAEALDAYGRYIESECGYIQLDGLPADSEVGSRRLRLENLFVPLYLDVTVNTEGEKRIMERQAVGTALAEHPRLALLAAPGGGKSTLAKRLAIAYADPARREQIKDNLPPRDWLPLFFRCRELRSLARGSFAELLDALSQREPVRQHAAVFRTYVDRALLEGRILLLVDGLDEISDQGDRAAFVCTIRTALQAYPGIATVITSREAGFRHVAAHIAPVCTHAMLSPFDEDDICRLSVAWHREVVGNTEKVRMDAEKLASIIIENDRIQRLAVNPLLLTTLLLVKRWVGSLPTRRAVLYGKAVEVLLMTWNTEGHEPIPEEEALPQLCYVASTMMIDGVQKISRPKLTARLQEARDAMPTELGYVRNTVDQFVHRIEDRSSLLQMAGHDVEDGQLVEFFEFRHLTFQEFLTAQAMVKGWHRDAKDTDTLAGVLEQHFEKEEWCEVIPLAAALGGKKTEALIQRLTTNCQNQELRPQAPKKANASKNYTLRALMNCLADEASARPEIIRAAIRELVCFGRAVSSMPAMSMLVQGRYGADFTSEARKAFLAATNDYINNAAWALSSAVWWKALESSGTAAYGHVAEQFVQLLASEDELVRCEGALGCVRLCWSLEFGKNPEMARDESAYIEHLHKAGPALMRMLFSERQPTQYAATWAVGWLGMQEIVMPIESDVIGRLFSFCLQKDHPDLADIAKGALIRQPIGSREKNQYCCSVSQQEFMRVMQGYDELTDTNMKIAILIVAWHLAALSDNEIIKRAHELITSQADKRVLFDRRIRELLNHLDTQQGQSS